MSLESIRARRNVLEWARPLGMFSDDVTRDYDALLAVAEAAKAVEASTVCAHDHDASDCPWPALAHALEALEAQP